jgi:hypothetical protein
VGIPSDVCAGGHFGVKMKNDDDDVKIKIFERRMYIQQK